MTRLRLSNCIRRMNDATERLHERRGRGLERRRDLHRINCGHGNELSEAARQSSDTVFAIKLALMTISRAAITAKNFTPAADAVQPLVHYNAIAFTQVVDRATHLLDDAGDFVAEDLRLQSERNRLTILVRVVVGVTSKDVQVGATKTNRRHSNQHFVRRDHRTRNVSHFETLHVTQHTRLHLCAFLRLHSRSLVSSRPSSRNTANLSIVSRTPISSGVDGSSRITFLMALSSIAAAIGISGPPKVIKSPFVCATCALMKLAMRSTVTVSPCRLKTCAPSGVLSAHRINAAAESATY